MPFSGSDSRCVSFPVVSRHARLRRSGYARVSISGLAGRVAGRRRAAVCLRRAVGFRQLGLGWRILLLPVLLLVGGIITTDPVLPERLPVMFVRAKGQRSESWCEYSVMALNLLAAGAFLARINHPAASRQSDFSLRHFPMALSESFCFLSAVLRINQCRRPCHLQDAGVPVPVSGRYSWNWCAPYLRLEQSRRVCTLPATSSRRSELAPTAWW